MEIIFWEALSKAFVSASRIVNNCPQPWAKPEREQILELVTLLLFFSINAFIYMKYNQALREKLLEMFCGKIVATASLQTGTIQLQKIGGGTNSRGPPSHSHPNGQSVSHA